MGLFKGTVTTIGKVIAAPAKFIYPSSSRATSKRLFNYDNRVSSVYCPSCGDSYLKMFSESSLPTELQNDIISDREYNDVEDIVYWGCPECHFCYVTPLSERNPKDTINDVKEFIREEGRDGLLSQSVFNDDERNEPIIKNQMRAAYTYYFLAVIATVLFAIGIFQAAFFFCLTIMLFIATFVLTGFKWSYRAWQLHTGNVYSDDPKQQFLGWLSNNNPFKYPNR